VRLLTLAAKLGQMQLEFFSIRDIELEFGVHLSGQVFLLNLETYFNNLVKFGSKCVNWYDRVFFYGFRV